jgi:uncharacterized membrane protein
MENSGIAEALNLIFRWIHVVAGIMWIGHLWFFNFVNAQLAKTYDPDSKKKVLPELMPRALYWFRWGAAYTWITGLLLFGVVYAMGNVLVSSSENNPPVSPAIASLIVIGVWIVGFGVYDMMWKSGLGKNEKVAAAVSFVLAVVAALGLGRIVTGRALLISIGGLFGTIMAANVWMRIWPAQRKIIAGVKGTAPAPDASVAATAGLRSKHNTYMSVPLVFFMVSNHFPGVYGFAGSDQNMAHDFGWLLVAGFVAVGWLMTKFMYSKSAGEAPKSF